MSTETFLSGRAFLTPAFRIKLDGREVGREVIQDVLEVSFTDEISTGGQQAAISSFEFVVDDWDPVQHRPRYSSPWDEQGVPLKLYDGGPEVPNFEPGARVSLHMGYHEEDELPLIMHGEVVSLAPDFPGSGAPSCRIRALDAFLRGLQKIRVEGNYDGTPKAIVDTLCREHDVTVRWATLDTEGEADENVEVDGVLYDAIASRAQEYGLSLTVEISDDPADEPTLYLAQPSQANDEPVAELVWGRTLLSFSPVLSAANQVSAVVCRGGNPDASGADQNVEVVRTWADIGLSPSALGPAGVADLESAVGGMQEVIRPDGVETEADAERAALARLRELAAELITGQGKAIGLPTLRAGRTVVIKGLGARYSGTYRLTRTTHSIGGSGYTTSFDCRKEVLGDQQTQGGLNG